MKSQDTQDFAKKIADAVQSGEPELFGNAMQEYGEAIQDAIMHDIEGKQQERDVKILKARGKNELTAKEVKFYDALRESIVKEAPIRMAIGSDSYTNTLPETIIDRIFEDLAQEHPLLGAVQLQNKLS